MSRSPELWISGSGRFGSVAGFTETLAFRSCSGFCEPGIRATVIDRRYRFETLRNEAAGVAGGHEIVDLALGSGADPDHFVDANKMIGNRVA